jgi:hypothetical protein
MQNHFNGGVCGFDEETQRLIQFDAEVIGRNHPPELHSVALKVEAASLKQSLITHRVPPPPFSKKKSSPFQKERSLKPENVL